ncbi:MAG TPA: phospholipase [Acetobacteraceae bacterium]|nr:phospholipase [Acetobacteraceae bacterium]
MEILTGPTWGPASGGRPKQLVVLCHGLGADGDDLIDLAPYWSQAVPDAAFSSPHAPSPYDMLPPGSGMPGRQWFSIGNFDLAALTSGVREARAALDAYLDAELKRLELPPDAYALMGFSQGAMTVLFTGLRRPVPPRGILAYSGALMAPETLAAEITGKPPVLLVHGKADPVVPVSRSQEAERSLREAGVPVQSLYPPQLAHGIDEAGLSAGALFLQHIFAPSRQAA